MDIILEEVNRSFAPEVTVYKFVGTVYELQDVVREPIPMLSADNAIYFSVRYTDISTEDSRFSIFREGV